MYLMGRCEGSHSLLVMHWELWVAPVPDKESYSWEGFVTFAEYSGPNSAKQSTLKSLLNICDPSDLKLVEFWLLRARIFSTSQNYALYSQHDKGADMIWVFVCLSFWWYWTQVHSSVTSACFLMSKYKPWIVLRDTYIF